MHQTGSQQSYLSTGVMCDHIISLAAAFLCTDVASAPDRKEDKH